MKEKDDKKLSQKIASVKQEKRPDSRGENKNSNADADNLTEDSASVSQIIIKETEDCDKDTAGNTECKPAARVKPKNNHTKPFNFEEAHQALLAEYPVPQKKPVRVSRLTCKNLEKFTKHMNKDDEVSKIERPNLQTYDTNLPMYERFQVTHDDIRRARRLKDTRKEHTTDPHHNQCNNAKQTSPQLVKDAVPEKVTTKDVQQTIEENVDNTCCVDTCNDNKNSLDIENVATANELTTSRIDSLEVRLISELSNLSLMTNPDLTDEEIDVTDSNQVTDSEEIVKKENAVQIIVLDHKLESEIKQCNPTSEICKLQSELEGCNLASEKTGIQKKVVYSTKTNEVCNDEPLTCQAKLAMDKIDWRICGKEVVQVCTIHTHVYIICTLVSTKLDLNAE